MRLPDQFGDTVALWQFSGDLLLLDFSSMWGVQMWPRELAALGAEYADAGLTTVSVIVEDQYGETADTADLQDWQAATGAVGPVLSDPEIYRSQVSSEEAWPEILVIGRDLRVIEAGLRWQEEGEIRARVEEHLWTPTTEGAAAALAWSPAEQRRVEMNRRRQIVGTPASVKSQLLELAGTYGVGELVVVTICHDFEL